MQYSRELKAGVIVLITMIGFWWMFQYLKGKEVFSKGNVYYIHYDNLDGLETTKDVSINGMKVGKVDEIESIPGENGSLSFQVKIRVDDQYQFNRASIAEIYAPGIMDGKEIRILLSDKPPLAVDGDELQGRLSSSLMDGIEPIKEDLGKVMKDLDSTLLLTSAVMRQVQTGNLAATLQNTNSTLSAFKNTSDKATQLLEKNTDEINALLRDANFIMASLDKTVNKYGKVADKVNELDVEKSLQDLQVTMGKVDKLLDNLNNDQGTLNKLLTDPSLYDNLESASENLNSLMADLEANPKKYFQISVFGKK